jgi:hypothetical protein
MDQRELERWLLTKNSEYRQRDIAPKARPFLALSDLSVELQSSILFNSPLANSVFDWFEKNTKADAHWIGSLFAGSYFYDATFWKLTIPLIYGSRKVNALDLLVDMPEAMKAGLKGDNKESWEFAFCAADTIDYALGFDEVLKHKAESELVLQLLQNGDAQLRSCATGLLAQHPNRGIIQAGRLATEIFLKSLLCARANADEAKIREFGHRLPELVKAAFAATQNPDLSKLELSLGIYPSITDRYTGTEEEPRLLWDCYRVALGFGATAIRVLTGRDTRPQCW